MGDLYEFDITDIIESKFYNSMCHEEVKEMSIDRVQSNTPQTSMSPTTCDIPMEIDDEESLSNIKNQRVFPNGLVVWNKGNKKSRLSTKVGISDDSVNVNQVQKLHESFSAISRSPRYKRRVVSMK